MQKTPAARTILVVEDDSDDRLLTAEAFTECGSPHEVHFVEDGEEALDYLNRRGKYDNMRQQLLPGLILLDLNMPRKDGREVLREIKASVTLRQTPVVILTTSMAEEDIQMAYELGVSSFIVKPERFESLVSTIRLLCEYWFSLVKLPRAAVSQNHGDPAYSSPAR
ncbi:MAG TPA: response regulator [Planctomycetota bacterium]|nr:response regulator [Planctomycetota bacterium]